MEPTTNTWLVYQEAYVALNDAEVATLAAMLQADVAWLQDQKKVTDDANTPSV